MNRLEEQLLREEAGKEKVLFSFCSGTRIDAGRWWRRTPIWLCVVGHELIMFAVARRRYVKRVSLEDCKATHYCHATGELVIAPCEDLAFRRFEMSLAEALQVMRAMGVDGHGRFCRETSDSTCETTGTGSEQQAKESI